MWEDLSVKKMIGLELKHQQLHAESCNPKQSFPIFKNITLKHYRNKVLSSIPLHVLPHRSSSYSLTLQLIKIPLLSLKPYVCIQRRRTHVMQNICIMASSDFLQFTSHLRPIISVHDKIIFSTSFFKFYEDVIWIFLCMSVCICLYVFFS